MHTPFGSAPAPVVFSLFLLGTTLPSDRTSIETRRPNTASGIRALAELGSPPSVLVRSALNEAAAGDASRWSEYLSRAIQRDPHYAAARWHTGQIHNGDRWLTIDQAIDQSAADELIAEYRERREACPDTADDLLKLARWCRTRGLKEEERAHLVQVLLKEPNNAAAHSALGNKRVRGMWVSADELDQMKRQQERVRESLLRWSSQLEAIRLRLDNPDEHDSGRDRLRAIAEPDLIPALERLLSQRSEPLANTVLDALQSMPQPDVSVSIVRHAVFSPWQPVRSRAASLLKDRPLDHFVPMLISTLRGPIATQYAITLRPDGRLLYEHILQREGAEANEQVVFESLYRRRTTPVGNGRRAAQNAFALIQRNIANRERIVANQNATTSELNQRITSVLNAATDAELGSNPNDWWQWWAGKNGVYYARSEKPTATTRYLTNASVSDIEPARYECLVAGTPVWTSTGRVPIEQIRPGDRVLAQDPETGELAFKPVLRTTARPPCAVVTVKVNDESLTASEGHPFWVHGTGWMWARDLKAGNMLHAVGGGLAIDSVQAESELQRTYNLVVADFHSYFIGAHRLLVHDNTVRRPTSAKVPGQTD